VVSYHYEILGSEKCTSSNGSVVKSQVIKITMQKQYRVDQSHYKPETPRGFQDVKVPTLRDNGPGWY